MNEETYRSLCKILDYLYEDEQGHWEENERPTLHIFTDIRQVQGWADEVRGKLP
ncbi:MAG TPA: hypothetical protein VI895_08235 [Bdellovibrionota bacterium]|nr:hypothetical protein [Bdellovibrionota bacterium]